MKKKIILGILIALVACIAIIFGYRVFVKVVQGSRPSFQRQVIVGTEPLKKQKVDKTLSFRGIAEGDPQVKIYPTAAGRLLENNVREGMAVAKDEPVVSIDRDIAGSSFQPAIVRSPISGIVTKLYYLDRGDPITMEKPVAEVANTQSIKVVLNVGEEDLASVKPGMECAISPAYDPNAKVQGSVFSTTPFVDSETLSGNIVVKAKNVDTPLKVGISVNVAIKTGSVEAYLVPASAIIMEYDNSYVFVNDNGTAKRVPVLQGYSSGSLVEISGADLADGMKVVTEGSFKLTEGAKISEGGEKKQGGGNQDKKQWSRDKKAGNSDSKTDGKELSGEKKK
jgi:multidrug efflux pump subunit AcrA (membrane-fusion protein)